IHAEISVDSWVTQLPSNLVSVAHIGLWALIIPFVCFFWLQQSRECMNTLFDWTPAHHVESLLGFLAEVNAALGGFIRGQILDALCVGLITMIGLGLLGFNGAVLMGVFVGFLNLVPLMAPVVGGGVALLAGYLQGLPVPTLFGIVCLFILVRLID